MGAQAWLLLGSFSDESNVAQVSSQDLNPILEGGSGAKVKGRLVTVESENAGDKYQRYQV